jgi:hypothetical protein
MLDWNEISKKAIAFSKRWEGAHNEEAQSQAFVIDFLKVFGVEDPEAVGDFEYKVKMADGYGKIDYLWKGKIAIEMKSKGKNLDAAFNQLITYICSLPNVEVPDLWLVCDFKNIRLYNRSINKSCDFETKVLSDNIKRFSDIAGYGTEIERIDKIQVNIHAAGKMAMLHDALKARGYLGHDLEVYLVRLLFCMFAEDSGIFPKYSFLDYIGKSKKDGSDLHILLENLFDVLNMPQEIRDAQLGLSDEFKFFQYINGNLFKHRLRLASFDIKMRGILLDCLNFDWSQISPAIFGAMFQGVMDKEKRREIGAHYTSEENILKLINPLFMDDLRREFKKCKSTQKDLKEFHKKISELKFLDPACGCGNFLIIAYRELRLLELEILNMLYEKKVHISFLVRVNVEQFYGIEYEDFPCQIAKVGMWLVDHQMNLLVSRKFGDYFVRLPLSEGANITQGNALRVKWEDIVPNSELSYIFGNPPFAGRRYRTDEQIAEVKDYFKYKDVDYVACWYVKSAQYIQNTTIKCAFVSTSSICQGEQVKPIWKPLFDKYGLHINFSIPSFKWSNEGTGKAAVYCIIIGFSLIKTKNDLNPYLLQAPVVFIGVRSKPLCDVPIMKNGNVPLDGDTLKIEPEDYEKFKNCKCIKRLLGGEELVNNTNRYVLWLVGANPKELRNMPLVLERVEKCRAYRLKLKDQGSRKLAETPTTFRDKNNPDRYIALPLICTEKRKYIPMGFFDGDTIPTNQVQTIPHATLYHFGILMSSVHMAWVKTVCGRLGTGYRYSKDIVYNNFPWPEATDQQKSVIEILAQGVLEARNLYEDSSLADLYDPLTMPQELLKVHQDLDRAVMKLYGFRDKKSDDGAIVVSLMKIYQEILKNDEEELF